MNEFKEKDIQKTKDDKKDLVKCLKCDVTLLSGFGCSAFFSQGTSIECKKCGNKHKFVAGF